jgi:hypothetical protein
MRNKAHTALTAPLVLHRTRFDKCAMKKFGINGQLWNKLFLIVIRRFSLVKAAMNALCICKMRNGVRKTPSFLLFSTAQVRNEYSPQLSKLLNNCKLKNKEALLYFKGLSEDGRRADFSKNLRCLSH